MDKQDKFDNFKAGKLWKILRVLRRIIVPDGSLQADLIGLFLHAIPTLKDVGVSGFFQVLYLQFKNRTRITYKKWIAKNENWDKKAVHKDIFTFTYKPTISVIVPVYNIDPIWLDKCIQSVTSQIYENWELCLYDDASNNTSTLECLKQWLGSDTRIKIVFGKKNLHISEATNKAIDMATGEFIAFLDHDDEMSPYALYFVTRTLNNNPELDILYSDEDKVTEKGIREAAYFKPDWNPDLLLSQNYFNHLSVYRTELVRKLGGCKKGLEGAQDWDLALRTIESIPESHIHHIPYILYHWRRIPGSVSASGDEKSYISDAQYRCLSNHFERINKEVELIRLGPHWRIKYHINHPGPQVSLIIPTRDGYPFLNRCIESICEKTTYQNFEILIIDNGTTDTTTLEYFSDLERHGKATVIQYSKEFNYSAINNFAVQHAKGQVIGLLNNDLEVITPEWLEEMVSQAMRPEIGAVGAKLLYPNGTLQHAGVILGIGGVAGHWLKRFPGDNAEHFNRPNLTQNISAVTAACLIIRRSIFEEVGGLDEVDLKIAFNDIDFCMKVQAAGYRNLYTPFAVLYHHESATRGTEDTHDKRTRFAAEAIVMKQRWGKILLNDPAYNLNLTLEREDGSVAARTRAEKI